MIMRIRTQETDERRLSVLTQACTSENYAISNLAAIFKLKFVGL